MWQVSLLLLNTDKLSTPVQEVLWLTDTGVGIEAPVTQPCNAAALALLPEMLRGRDFSGHTGNAVEVDDAGGHNILTIGPIPLNVF